MRYRKSDQIVERSIRGEHILVPIMGNLEQLDSIYTLNSMAGLIFARAAAGADAVDIAEEILAQHRVAPDRALADVCRVLAELVHLGRSGEPGPVAGKDG